MAKVSCCGQELATEEALVRHQVEGHGVQRRVVGSCCGQDFYTEEGLKEHQQEHLRATHGRSGLPSA